MMHFVDLITRPCTALTGARAHKLLTAYFDCGRSGGGACRMHLRWHADLNWTQAGIGSFVRNLFGSKSEDQPPVHDEARLEPSGPKAKPATSKPKHPAVAAADAHPAKPRSQPANTETAIARVPKPSPKPQSTLGSATPPLLSGA